MLQKQFHSYISDKKGNILILLAVFLLILVLGIALAVDIGRAQVLRSRMQAQVDSAALAVGLAYNKNPSMSPQDIQAAALQYFTAGFPKGYLGITSVSGKSNGIPDLTVQQDASGHITLKAIGNMNTYFTSFLNINHITIGTQSTILHDVISPTEIVLALDITGSMAIALPPDNATKYAGLVTAATDFINVFASKNTNNQVFIGIVPYTQTVNIGLTGVTTVPLGGNLVTPTWNTGNTWLDAGDPALKYDWGDVPTTGYGTNGTPVINNSNWNIIGNITPQGWGGCVMARNPAVNGAQSGLPLDISDDPPSVAPFQRFYYPSDNWSIVLPPYTGGNSAYKQTPANDYGAIKSAVDLGCGFGKYNYVYYPPQPPQCYGDQPAQPAYTQPAHCDTNPGSPARTETNCGLGEAGCTTVTIPAVPPSQNCYPAQNVAATADIPAHCDIIPAVTQKANGYDSFLGYNPWICHSVNDATNPSSTQPTLKNTNNREYSHIINKITDNKNIYFDFPYDSPKDQNGNYVQTGFIGKDEPWLDTGGPNYTCPMTKDKNPALNYYHPFSLYPLQPPNDPGLLAEINAINTIDQNTAFSNATTINIGLAWSWRLMSQRWNQLWNDAIDSNPALQWRDPAKKPANLKRYVILMTDGQNNTTNSSSAYHNLFGVTSYTAYGIEAPFGINPDPTKLPTSVDPNTPDITYLNQKTIALCTAMGKDNITIYTIGFGTTGTGTNTDVDDVLLTSCANATPGGKYFPASNNEALVKDFKDIADAILNNLRVVN